MLAFLLAGSKYPVWLDRKFLLKMEDNGEYTWNDKILHSSYRVRAFDLWQ